MGTGTWDRPLDGVAQVPWEELLAGSEDATANGIEMIRALTAIAAGDEVYGNCERIGDMLTPDADFRYSEWGQDFGYGRAAPAVVGFLARIAASHTDDHTTTTCIEWIENLVNTPIEPVGATDEDVDAHVDAIRSALLDNRAALREAARRLPEFRPVVDRLIAEAGAGAYEPRWRGVARPFAASHATDVGLVDAGRPLVVGLHTYGATDFHDPGTGTVVVSSPEWWRESTVWPLDDPAGPMLVTGKPRRVWRHRDGAWSARYLGHPLRSLTVVAVDDGEILIRYARNVLARLDARTGARIGPEVPLPWGREVHTQSWHPYRSGGRRFVLVGLNHNEKALRIDLDEGVVDGPPLVNPGRFLTSFELDGRTVLVFAADGAMLRVDAESGEGAGDPIEVPRFTAWRESACVYRQGDRPMLAVASGRRILRFDARTGAEAGPPMLGHRREVIAVRAAVIGGRPTLFSVDYGTIRRWDAVTGVPWPAPISDAEVG
ncbi:hypothetical protein [Actinoplanes subglobosus]|uniref:Uncharacterized protein n=1 Tax=Actinoplanes subglobosus TaxID=1547892 RepID=A0ABV8J0K7_9ACTN